MGLDTSHDCWHGPYSAFSAWRNQIAEAAGYCVWTIEHDGWFKHKMVMLEWHRYQENKELRGDWDETPSDPLIVLFAHSDCEGVIHPAQAGPLADALERLLPRLNDDGTRWSTKARTERFIAGLRDAVAKGEDIDFH